MDDLISQINTFVSDNIVPYGWSLLTALGIFIIGKWAAGLLSRVAERGMKRHLDATVANFAANMVRIALLALVIIASLDAVGVETTSLVAILGAAGLAVGLALKDSLGNFAAGVMLILFKPFRVGHFVEAGGASGTVKEIRIFATILKTGDNKIITVPNGAIMSDNITNYSEMPTRRVDMVFGVGYDANLAEVKTILQSVLAEDDRVLDDPAPVIAVSELADSSVNLICRPWVNSADYWTVLWDTTEKVKQRFDDADIAIPFPQMDIHIEKTESE